MKLPLRAKLVIAAAMCGGVASALGVLHLAPPALGNVWTMLALTGLVLASWLWPIVMYSESSSQGHHLDEGFFLVLAIVLHPEGVLCAFVLAALFSQVIRRRPAVKSLFNLSQILIAVGAGLAVQYLVDAPTSHLTVGQVGAGVLGALVYFFANSLSVASILAATGAERFRVALTDGLQIRALLLAASVSLGVVSAVAVAAYPAAAAFVGVPFWAFRQALAGHFSSRHDRSRLLGLFNVTLDIQKTMGDAEVTTALSAGASNLLRCPDATVASTPPPEGAMAARMTLRNGDRWLTVSGRSRTEPFDDADRVLLDALAAVGAGALDNAVLYDEGRRQREQLDAITSSLGEGVCAMDADGMPTFFNPAAEALLGGDGDFRPEQLPATTLAFLREPALQAMASRSTVRNERASFARPDGTYVPVAFTCSPIMAGDRPTGAVVAFRDITERVAFEEQLAFHAFHDALTSLPNRRVFLDHLQHALARAVRSGEVHAVLFADVDRFKVANDSLGHQAGDELLRVIADRLRSLVREGDTLARFGGDEFTLLVENIGGSTAAEAVAQRMLEVVREPVILEGGRSVVASVSVGVALTSSGVSADDVLHDADVAMYQAKHQGAGHYAMFDATAMSRRSAEWVDLEAELRAGIERDELTVYYQPLYASESRRIVGVEALVRWNHPVRGLLQPSEFIALAEETGLILPLGRYVLEAACRQGRRWRHDYDVPLSIAVNLSARQFQQHGLVDEIAEVLVDTGLDPGQLCLEITESLAVQDMERTISTLTDLKRLGVRLAIDDFGTGYSSLNYLKRFPVDVVKLDRSFVHDLDISPVDTAIVAAVVDLARTVGMTAVAEGVETEDQMVRLTTMGCPVVQGYFLARPMPAEAISDLLEPDRDALPQRPALRLVTASA